MSKISFKSGTSLKALLEGVIESSLKASLHQKALQEKEKQAQASSGAPSQEQGGEPSSEPVSAPEDNEEAQEPSETPSDDDEEAMKKGEVEPKDIIEKLNSIRSGKSFKDSAVSGAMEQYIESLSVAERTALLAFLKGIAQIVTGEVDADSAIEPDSNPANVQMQKKDSVQKKTVKPNVIKDAPKQSTGDKPAEDTSAPVATPIAAKKR